MSNRQRWSKVLAWRRRPGAWCVPSVFACCCLLAACGKSEQPTAAAPEQPAADPFTQVAIPESKLRPGDVIAPLPAGSPLPSNDPRDLEGIWVGVGSPVIAGGMPPYLPAVKVKIQERMEKEKKGAPVADRHMLCRPPGVVTVTGNQFPTQILQRADKMLILAEENRGVWPIYMDAEHPKDLKPSYVGHNIGRWEGNTLVIDSVGFNGKPNSAWNAMGAAHSTQLHVVTRITRASTADKLNGARLVIEQTIEDPQIYERAWTSVFVARWRPDAEMLEFNCEESPQDLISDGLVVE